MLSRLELGAGKTECCICLRSRLCGPAIEVLDVVETASQLGIEILSVEPRVCKCARTKVAMRSVDDAVLLLAMQRQARRSCLQRRLDLESAASF